MAVEFNAFLENDTWKLVPGTSFMHVEGCKQLYKTKYGSYGLIECYKLHVVDLGNHQQAGIECHEAFSVVAEASSVRLILSIVVLYSQTIHQLDMKNAFLYGYLAKVLLIKQPPSFVHLQFANYVCHLKKSLCGLKQAPYAWFHHFSSFLLSYGFICRKVDNSVFVYR